MRTNSLTVFATLALTLSLVACDPGAEPGEPEAPDTPAAGEPDEPEERPTIRLAGGDSGFPSPFGYMRGGGYVQMQFIYETLLWKDASGELLPWLADSFEASDDGLTYTFELRDDVAWQDGEPFTADDVAFTFAYFDEHDISPQVIVQPVPGISDVTATGEHTVEFTLDEPQAIFLSAVAGAVPIVPEHVWADVDDPGEAADLELLVGTGPYRLESYSPGEGSYLYVANDNYFLGTPFVERIEFIEVADELTALQAGEIDQGGGSGLRPDALAPFEDGEAFEVLQAPIGGSVLALYWNLDQGGALADPDFRKATALAIDREDLVERAFGGNGTPGNPGWLPPDHPDYVEVEQYSFDLDAANDLLDEAGYERGDDGVRTTPDGEPLRFELLAASPAPPVVDVIVSSLAEVGVELEVQAVDTPTFNERVIAGETEMSVIGAGGVNSDPDYLREVYDSRTERTQHAQGYANPRVDELAEAQLRELDEDQRSEIVGELQELIAEDLPLLPLFYPHGYTIYDRDVFDEWYYTPGGVAVRIPTVNNRHVFATGRQEGLEPRTANQ